jgi:hypothetical protein
MANRGCTSSFVLLASVVALACLFVIVADDAGATITGKQLPNYGEDWVIDANTDASNQKINLQGSILIEPGYTLKMRGITLTFNSSSAGEHGIDVKTGGSLEVDDFTVSSDFGPNGWFFNINGPTKMSNNVRLNNVQNGVRVFHDQVSIKDTTINAQGDNGLYIDQCNPSVTDTVINLHAISGYGKGVYVYGTTSNHAKPTFNNLKIKVYQSAQWKMDSSSVSHNFEFYGLHVLYGEIGTLQNIEITFDESLDATLNTTSMAYLRVYFRTYGIQLEGDTNLTGFNNVSVADGTYYVNAKAENTQSGRLYLNSYFYGLRNMIASAGSTPDTLTGLEITNHTITYDDNGIYTSLYRYYYGRGIYWYPSTSATSSTTFTIDGLVLSGLESERLLDIGSSWEFIMEDCDISWCFIDDYFIRLYRLSNPITIQRNHIYNNSMPNDYYFYIYYPDSAVKFTDNNISGNQVYRMLRVYNSYKVVTIENNVFMDNQLGSNGRADDFFQIWYSRAVVTVEENKFLNNSYRWLFSIQGNYEDLTIANNEFGGNTGTDYMFWVYQSRSEVVFKDNEVYNNSMMGGFEVRYNYDFLVINRNTITGNNLGGKPFVYLHERAYSGFEILDNYVAHNDISGKMFHFRFLGYWASNPVTFEKNEFFNNSGSSAVNSGILYYEYIKQGFTVRSNEFENNSINGIVCYMPYTQWYNYPYSNYGVYFPNPDHWFYVESNTFINNSAKGIVFAEIDNCNIQIRGNKGSGNTDYPVYLEHTKYYEYHYTSQNHPFYWYSYLQGVDLLRVESNNFTGNPGGGLFLKTSYQREDYYSSSYGNPNQEIIVKNNILRDNGQDGWAIALYNLYHKPSVKNNDFSGSDMGLFMGMVKNDPRRKMFSLEFRDIVMDGGTTGMTAFGFEEIDADFYDCSLLGYKECFYAKDSTINAWWSAIPEAGGVTEEKGRIYVWNHLEIWVSWANASKVDSGVPVRDAVVALRGYDGDYFGARKTNDQGILLDEDGRPEPLLINPWTCIDGEMNQKSPFTATIMSSEVSTAHKVHVIGEYVGPDNPMRLTLIDYHVPEVIISNPQDGTLVNTASVLFEGFLFEIGSGIVLFEGQTDMMAEDEWEPLAESVLWQHVFEDVSEGSHNISVRAADLSGNWNTSMVSIIVDLTDPELSVHMEYLNETRIPWDETKQGYFVREKTIRINGTYSDNFAHPRDIIIRINGQPEVIFGSQLGNIYKRIDLQQGINTIIIDATDTAGNRAIQRLYVSLDSYAPTLYIYSPLQGEKTANETMLVTGKTEDFTQLDILIQSIAGESTYRDVSGDGGTFTIVVDLFEGGQKILITATDSAGNPTLVSRDVTLDTEPPDFDVKSPPELYIVTNDIKYKCMGQMTKEPDALTYINGQQVPNYGVFNRTLVLQEGENLIEFKAVDKVGNEQVKYATIVRDTVDPILEVTFPEGDFLLTRDATIHFTGMVTGALSVVIEHKATDFPVDFVGNPEASATWTYDLELGPTDLDQYILVKATDRAQNEVIMSFHVIYDVVAPILTVAEVPDVTEEATIWLNGSTDEAILVVYIQGIEYPVKDGLFNVLWPLSPGNNSLTVQVMDDAGNPSVETFNVVYNQEIVGGNGNGEGEEESLSWVWGAVFIVAAITVIVTAVFVTTQRRR